MNTFSLEQVKELLKKQREICASQIVNEPDEDKNIVAMACKELALTAPEPPLPNTPVLSAEEENNVTTREGFHELVDELAEWSIEVFGERKPLAPAYKLREEVNELIEAMEKDPDNWRAIESGLADCFLIIVDICKKQGLTSYGILSNGRDKFDKIKKRKWGKPDENGTFQHIEEHKEEENNGASDNKASAPVASHTASSGNSLEENRNIMDERCTYCPNRADEINEFNKPICSHCLNNEP